jgi:hypothetical protein
MKTFRPGIDYDVEPHLAESDVTLLPTMNRFEMAKLRQRLKWGHARLAQELGVSVDTTQHLQSGHIGMRRCYGLALRHIEQQFLEGAE